MNDDFSVHRLKEEAYWAVSSSPPPYPLSSEHTLSLLKPYHLSGARGSFSFNGIVSCACLRLSINNVVAGPAPVILSKIARLPQQ